MSPSVRPVAVALACLALLGSLPGLAQDTCEQRLRDAESSYREGRFDAVAELLQPCLVARGERQARIEAYALLAKTYLAEDRMGEAREAVRTLLALKADFEPSAVDPPRFAALVAEARKATGLRVSSVSKTEESLIEAPATVAVLTGRELRDRGYNHLEEVVDDLPGFDVSRTNGTTYSNVYQRGYRSDETNRTLFLIDGVEENDLWSSTIYLSRQFPLSNVKRMEVVYGPASTIYGANAFAGVINVITKEPEDYLEDGQRFAVDAVLGSGSFGTHYVDATVAGRSAGGSLSYTLTSRVFRSDEPDLSGFEDWNYDPADFADPALRDTYLDHLSFSGPPEEVQQLLDAHPEIATSGDFDVAPGSIRPTDQGIARAIALDQGAYDQLVGGRRPDFSDPTRSWLVNGKLKISNLTFGFESWRDEEGATPSSTDLASPGAGNGARWTPKQTWFYVRYSHDLPHNLRFTLFSRYKEHTLDGSETVLTNLNSYLSGALGVVELADGVEPSWQPTYFYLLNTQLRNELRLVYDPSERLDVVAGLELRNGSIQGNYVTSDRPDPSETGTPPLSLRGSNDFETRDIGLFAQASYQAHADLKLVAGGRLDSNEARQTGGYGTVFNPRLAVVYTPGDAVLKAVYSEAFQDASNFQRYATFPGVRDLDNPDLQPERVKNLELSAGWKVSDHVSADVSAFDARYSDVVQLVPGVPCGPPVCTPPRTTSQFQAVGALRIRGLQAQAEGRWGDLRAYASYTYTDPFNTGQDVPIGDIARHKLNSSLTTPVGRRLRFHLRGNYVGTKRTGAGTDVASNPLRRIDSYVVADTALTYEDLLPGWSLQLAVDNLFDESYRDPGVRAADGVLFASAIPQPGRAVYLRLLTAHR